MEIATIEVLPEGGDAAVRVYRCSACNREMRLTVWATLPSPVEDRSLRTVRGSSATVALWAKSVCELPFR